MAAFSYFCHSNKSDPGSLSTQLGGVELPAVAMRHVGVARRRKTALWAASAKIHRD
jgi:hypothetical protein